ncbi:MAG: peptidylprolyl isomerase [Planctomycetes bacterium]|nr:peptidylprolyl isomerase [Planctomycetota bacterium]
MGKKVMLALALCMVWVSSNAPVAQEKPKAGAGREFPFVAGKYFTADDYEHVSAALGYVDLKPADLSFEKKVALNQRFVLPVCAQCLDNPLGVPKVAEDFAGDFRKANAGSARALAAARTLGLDTGRFTIDELKKDSELWKEWDDAWRARADHQRNLRDKGIWGKAAENDAELKRLRGVEDKARADLKSKASISLFGADCKTAQSTEAVNFFWSQSHFGGEFELTLLPSLYALVRDANSKAGDGLAKLAATLPANFAEDEKVRLPGADAKGLDGDWCQPAANVQQTGPIVAAGRLWHVLENLADAVRKQSLVAGKEKLMGEPSNIKGITGGVLLVAEGPLGKVAIGGTGDNTYEGDDFIAIIDLGGNDIYKGRVASGIGLPGKAPLSFVLDLAGDDRYMGEDFTQGFGFNGVGILWDLGAGNDYYKSRFCSQACGLLGYGELYDDGGDDQYFTDSGSQGAACFGYGHLIDAGGHDTYRGARYVQACALVGGVAVLTDGGGNDLYYAGGKYLHVPLHNDHYQSLSQGFSIGNRNDANPGMGTGGGVALLLDQGNGNDNYIADIYGQGSSYWLSLGMLVDEGGNDNHVLYQYGIGGGIHLSTGIHVDLAGNDTYTDPWGVGLGGAHDYAVGWLIDRAGNDLYQGGGQGQGLNFSFGCLLDCAGNDAHSCPGAGSIGAGHNNDVSLLLDLDGDDFYTVPDVKNGRFTRQGNHGLIYDCPSGGWFPGIDASTLPTRQDPAPKKVKVQHILISYTGVERVKIRNAESRTEAEAETLGRTLLKQARTKGTDWKKLMDEWSEDVSGAAYEVDESNRKNYVKEFGDSAMSLGIGQIALSAKGPYGWHIIKRVE